MKKLLFFLSAFAFVFGANAQLNNILVEEIVHTGMVGTVDLSGYTSYRVFAQTDSALDFVTEVTGENAADNPEVCTGSVCSTGDWYNNTSFGGNDGKGVAPALWGVFADTRFDTYYTIGFSSSMTVGVPEADDTDAADAFGILGHADTGSNAGIGTAGAWVSNFAAAPSGGCIVDISDATGGAWFALNGDPNGYGQGVNNSVLLGQFTTNGDYSHELNVSVIPEGGGPIGTFTHCNNPVSSIIYPEPPALDDCAGATAIVIDDPAITGDNTGAADENDPDDILVDTEVTVEGDLAAVGAWGTDGDDGDVWFSFMGTGGLVDVETFAGTSDDTQIAIYDDCAGTPLEADDDDGAGFMSLISGFCTTAGTTYYVEVEGWDGTVGDFTIEVRTSTEDPELYCSDPAASNYNDSPGACDVEDNTTCTYAPANDECANAEALNIDDAASAGTNDGALSDSDGCLSVGAPDVWYSFVGTGTPVDIETFAGTLSDSQIGIYDACGGASLECDDDDGAGTMSLITDFCAETGTTYYVQVQGWNGAVGDFTVQVRTAANPAATYCSDATAVNYNDTPGACDVEDNTTCEYAGCNDVTAIDYDNTTFDCAGVDGGTDTSCCTYPPANDDCANAEAVTIDGGAVAGTNENSTSDSDGCLSAGAPDVWYSFDGDGSVVDIEVLADGLTDSQLGIYDACGGTSLECDDDDGPGLMSLIEGFCTSAGTTYYLQVQGWNGAVGTFSIQVTSVAPATYCSDPAAANYNDSPGPCDVEDNTSCDYSAPNDEPADAIALDMTNYPVCNTIDGNNIDATDSGDSGSAREDVWYTFVPSWSGVKIEVANAAGDMDLAIELYDSDFNLITDADDTFTGGTEIMFSNVTVGDTYYINVGHWNIGTQGTFEICAQNLVECTLHSAYNGGTFGCGGQPKSSWLPAGGTVWYFDDGVNPEVSYESSTQTVTLADVPGLIAGTTYDVNINSVYEDFEVDSRDELYERSLTYADITSELRVVYRDAIIPLANGAHIKASTGAACGAEDYVFEITDVAASTVETVNASFSYVLGLTSIPGIQYDTEYSVRIAVVYGGGSQSPFGNAHTFFTGGIPETAVQSVYSSANNTLLTNQGIAAAPSVPFATDWEWEITRTDVTELPFVYTKGDGNRTTNVAALPLQAGATYNIRTRAIVPGATSAYGPAVEVMTVGGSPVIVSNNDSDVVILEEDAVKEDVIEAGIEMYPNPANDQVTLNITNIEEGTDKVLVDIFNAVGQLVQSEQLISDGNYVSTVVTLEGLAEGMYNVQITVGNTVTTERLIIQK